MGPRVLEGGLPRGGGHSHRSDLLSVLVRPVPRVLGGLRGGAQIGAHVIPGGGMSSQLRLSLIDRTAATVMCCTPDLCAPVGRGRGRRAAGRRGARSQCRPGHHRRRRAGRQHSGYARPHRAELGRARDRSPRPDRSRPRELRVPGATGRSSSQRRRVHHRDGRSGHREARVRRPARRDGDYQPWDAPRALSFAIGRATWLFGDRASATVGGRSDGSRAGSAPAPTTWSPSGA